MGFLAGDVRKHVSAAELREWATRLERCEMLLQVLGNDDRELVFDDAERARIDTFLSDQAAAQEQMGAEWEASRRQAQVWREELAATAQKQVARERAFSPQQVSGGGDESQSDSESDSCPTCPRRTSESVSWHSGPVKSQMVASAMIAAVACSSSDLESIYTYGV